MIAGCAGAVIGAIFAKLGVEALLLAFGKRIGEVKEGQRNLLSSAKASTISNVPGHGLPSAPAV